MPPHNQTVFSGTPNAGVVDEIENPEPAAGTNNWYTEDGYGGGGFGSCPFTAAAPIPIALTLLSPASLRW